MFITLQFPFVDLRWFLRYPLNFVPKRQAVENPGLTEWERIAKKEYVRCFGHYRVRNYVPKFRPENKKVLASDGEWRLLKLNDIWQDEYLYASTRRALRFEFLEKQELLDGKLCNPRAKVRALRFSPYDPTNSSWSPCMRIETGILYDVPKALEGNELIKALGEFIKLKVKVPVYKKDGAGRDAIVNKELKYGTLIEQQDKLARLMVNGTTAQYELRVHDDMIFPGEPLLSVHYSKDEIAGFPSNVISLPKTLTGNTKISYHPLKNPRIGSWLFELPDYSMKSKKLVKKRETIRNNTIAIMRYWSEFQAIIALGNAVAADSLAFSIKGNTPIQEYVNNATKFLSSGDWHGTQLDIIRNIMHAHLLAAPDRHSTLIDAVLDFKRQVAKKLISVGAGYPNIFVSYSHRDEAFLSVVQTSLADLYKNNQIAYFDDTYIKAGEEWEQKIINSLENASIAVLLFSKNFLESDYITTIEQPKIKERFTSGKLNIIPLLVHGDMPKQGFLSRIQFLNAGNPLSGCTEEKKTELAASLKQNILTFQEADDSPEKKEPKNSL